MVLKRIVAAILAAAVLITSCPIEAHAGDKADALLELEKKTYIRNLAGDENTAPFRSGASLSANMNGAQIEDCLSEFIDSEIEGTLRALEDIVTYAQRNEAADNANAANIGKYDAVIDLLTELRTVWTEAKSCRDIIAEDRTFILETLEALENGDVYTTEHEIESAANKVLLKADDLEKQIETACAFYEGWEEMIQDAQERYVSASSGTANQNYNDSLQEKIVRLRTGRAEEMKSLASLEPASAGKDIVIDVVSIHEIRIYALDEDGNPLKDAEVYCWPVNDSNPDRKKGPARKPNAEGYVTVPTVELGADENHYMTAGYEIVCPGYRTQYAEANYIKGAEIFWNKLEKNDPNEDIYVAGISLNGYDCKWYEKELYITDENTADQRMTVYLRSQSGQEFSGTADMKYLNRDAAEGSEQYTVMSSGYTSSGGAAEAEFVSKLCQNVAEDQENAMTFSLSTSVANEEITPMLRSEKSCIPKTQYVKNDALLDALYYGQVSLAWPGDVPFLNGMSMNFDVENMLKGHVYLLTNCSGLFAIFGSTTNQPMSKRIEELNNSWMTADSKKIEEISNSESVRYVKATKQEVEAKYKLANQNARVPGLYGGKSIYGNASFAVCGSYDRIEKVDFDLVFGLQVGFRGDWTKQMSLGPIPISVGWGFDMSATLFAKFCWSGWKYSGTDISATFRLLGYMSGGPGISMTFLGKTFTAGLGFRFQLTLMMTVPIFVSLDGAEEDPIFTFNICLSFYADFFFAHFVWNMWSGTGELNIRTGDFDFTSQPFWKKAQSASLSQAAGLSVEEGAHANESLIEEETFSQENINGDTSWPYYAFKYSGTEDSIPTYFTLHWDGGREYHGDCDYIFWVENDAAVKYLCANYDGSIASTFAFPSDVQAKLNSGEWKITGVRAATHPQIYDVHVRMGSTDTLEEVQVATVSVTIGTGWVAKSEVQDGQTITKEVPTGSVVVTRMYLYDGSMSVLQYPDENDVLQDVIFVTEPESPVSEAIGLIFSDNVRLKGWSPKGRTQIVENIVLDYTPVSNHKGSETETTESETETETTESESETETTESETETTESETETSESEETSGSETETTGEESSSSEEESKETEAPESAETSGEPALLAAPEENGDPFKPSNESNGAMLITFATSDDESMPGMIYFISSDPGSDLKEASIRGGEMPETNPVKQLIAGGGNYASIISLMEDGSIWFTTAYRAYSYCISEDMPACDVGDIAIVRTGSTQNVSSDYTLFCTPKAPETDSGAESTPLFSLDLEIEGYDYYPGVFTDYDVDLDGAPIFAGNLMGESYLYWFETFEDEESGEARTAVRGMCYSQKYNMMTSPYRLGILTGEDGPAPDGCTITSAPISSLAMSDGELLITKAWIPDSDEGREEADNILSTYKVNATKCVKAELMGAGTEQPAVSAGRDTNMLFTVINKGNIPILGFDFNIYHDNEAGVRELVQSSHVDVTNQMENKVTFLKNGYSEAHPIVFEGEYAARRVGGIFDMINGDEWNVTRSGGSSNASNGSVFVSVPALMPEGIHTYTMVFAVPIDWANKTEITCEIDKTYVPQRVADIFALSDAVGANANERAQMPVLALSAPENTDMLTAGEDGITANVAVAGSLNGFTEQNGSPSNDLLAGENDVPLAYLFKPAEHDVEFNVVNLSVKCRVFKQDGKDLATITVMQEGQTDHSAPSGVKLRAFLNDEEFPSFAYTFATHPDDGQLAYSITLPLETLTGGRDADRITVTVSDTVDENEEMAEIDDSCRIELNKSLKITTDPKDIQVKPGQDAEFSVEAKGGQEPYTYCWQKIAQGKWVDMEEGTEPTLKLRKVTEDMDGMIVRCIVKDSNGATAASETAKLRVGAEQQAEPEKENSEKNEYSAVKTGDTNHLYIWIIVCMFSLAAVLSCAGVSRKKKNR